MPKEECPKKINKAARAFTEGNFGEAIAILETVLHHQPDNIEALTNLGTIYCESGDAPRAIKFYQQALQYSPNNGLLWFYLSIALSDNHELAEALHASERALIFEPQNQKFWLNHGYLLRQSGVEITLEVYSFLRKKINEKRVEFGLPPIEIR